MSFRMPQSRTILLCGLLLCASFINYMDRQTLANVSKRIIEELGLSNQQYGSVEKVFGYAFACGSLFFGFAADYVPVRWLYPFVLVAWSAVGVATGYVRNLDDLLYCRMFLGFFEAGHWPCAMQTIRSVLAPGDRGLGNSVLQSGTSIGAIVTPQIIKSMLMEENGQLTTEVGAWRSPFKVLGSIGFFWVVGWLLTVRKGELSQAKQDPQPEAPSDAGAAETSLFAVFRDSRFWVLMGVVVAINVMWQFFRSWLPLFMMKGRGYTETQQLDFNMWFYIATDVGCIAAGLATKSLHSLGWSVFASRRMAYTVCALLCALSLLIPLTPNGPMLLGIWIVMGMGALGVFPCYYSFTQEISVRHPAKVFGILSSIAWFATAPWHEPFGKWVDELQKAGSLHAYDYGLAIVGLLPLIASAGLWLAWPTRSPAVSESASVS